jgi:hypothetical protein
MFEELSGPLSGSGIRIQDREQLEEFLLMPEAEQAVQASSFEQVFFTLKSLGLADSLELLPLVSARQARGFVDLDCWRKDSFVRKPFMEWVAAFVQAGPEEMVRALSGIDDNVIALFLSDLITVHEIERDEPPPATQLMYTPDNTLAVHQDGTGDDATISALILDGLFKYDTGLGYGILRKVRYTTRTELEETAYQNKVRRLDVHGFVDYYDALSIYAGSRTAETPALPRNVDDDEDIPGEEPSNALPTLFADSLFEGGFLRAAIRYVPDDDATRLGEELTALGNRILSANLVNLGEVEGIRTALGEMRDFLTIGLQSLSGGDSGTAANLLRALHAQAVFKAGFDLLVDLRTEAEKLARFPGFQPDLLEHPDQEFVAGLARFKPLLWDEGLYRHFRDIEEVEAAKVRVGKIRTIAECLIARFGPSIDTTLKQAFNTAVIQQAVSGRFDPVPVMASSLEELLADAVTLPDLDFPEELQVTLRGWSNELRADLEPLVGQKIDPRFVGFVTMVL